MCVVPSAACIHTTTQCCMKVEATIYLSIREATHDSLFSPPAFFCSALGSSFFLLHPFSCLGNKRFFAASFFSAGRGKRFEEFITLKLRGTRRL